MVSEEELSCEDDVWFFGNIIFHVKKKRSEKQLFIAGKKSLFDEVRENYC